MPMRYGSNTTPPHGGDAPQTTWPHPVAAQPGDRQKVSLNQAFPRKKIVFYV
ncbi:hypothetical protein RSSM_01866 [Rhodopirellula sallentina SM41]|uniref:Uncharacterized protein n=1 Tax=Rhodopirellula sallentina SM41 TaxID=1263870 RepID=M5U5Z1_9BACT|nr:hypothetical protein RSSM_01866 [Rhodopirellula sallentina SM41]